ncbi:hypothetical protein KEM55_005504, partial [Ascosphaera atra]
MSQEATSIIKGETVNSEVPKQSKLVHGVEGFLPSSIQGAATDRFLREVLDTSSCATASSNQMNTLECSGSSHEPQPRQQDDVSDEDVSTYHGLYSRNIPHHTTRENGEVDNPTSGVPVPPIDGFVDNISPLIPPNPSLETGDDVFNAATTSAASSRGVAPPTEDSQNAAANSVVSPEPLRAEQREREAAPAELANPSSQASNDVATPSIEVLDSSPTAQKTPAEVPATPSGRQGEIDVILISDDDDDTTRKERPSHEAGRAASAVVSEPSGP